MIRSLLFRFFFYLGTIVICIIFIPALIMPKKIDLIGGKILGYWIKVCLYIFLSVKIKIKGIENIPKDIPFFIASLHQSLIETFFLQTTIVISSGLLTPFIHLCYNFTNSSLISSEDFVAFFSIHSLTAA